MMVPNYNERICPGWVQGRPFVAEAENAVAALRSGCLSTYFPEGEASILKAAMELHGAFNIYEAEQMKKPK